MPAQTGNSLFQLKGSNLKDLDLNNLSFAELVVSFDFNISKCSWVVTRLEDGILKVIHSNKSDAMDTYEACNQFKLQFPLNDFRYNRFIITGDAAGKARSTSTKDNKNDYSIIESELKDYNISIEVPRSNPPVSNSVRHINRLFNDNLIYINKNNCSFLIHGLSSCTASNSGGINKSGKDEVSHIVDAFRYGIEYLDPSIDRKSITGSI